MRAMKLHRFDQFVVIGVRTDPEPDDLPWTRNNAEGSVVQADSHRVDSPLWMDQLESQTGVIGILPEPRVCLPRQPLD
jgi:hypothetical protein